jgi:hypothetical protein
MMATHCGSESRLDTCRKVVNNMPFPAMRGNAEAPFAEGEKTMIAETLFK